MYTDERGQQTTATIPVPLAPLAFTAPTAGAQVPIPTLRWPRPVASPPANAQCLDATQLDQPLVVYYTYPVPPGYTPPLPSQGAALTGFMRYEDYAVQKPFAIVTAQVSYGFSSPPPAGCGELSGLGQAATGTYALPFVITYSSGQFEQLVPAPGYVTLNLAMQWLPPAGGFHAILVDSQDSVTIPITWTTPQSGSADSVRA